MNRRISGVFSMRGLLFGLALFCGVPFGIAQMVTTSSPFHSVSDGFHETMGTSWSVGGKNWSVGFNQGGGLGQSQFGGSGGGVSTGFAFGNKNFSGQFNGSWTQGFSRTNVSQTPSVTTMNGAPGLISDTQLSPFVISNVPVVGAWTNANGVDFADPTGGALVGSWGRTIPNPAVTGALNRVRAAQGNPAFVNDSDRMLQAALGSSSAAKEVREGKRGAADSAETRAEREVAGNANGTDPISVSSAEVAVGSLAQMRKMRQEEELATQQKSLDYLAKARQAVADGRMNAAKSYYKTAYKYAADAAKPEIVQEYKSVLK